MEIRIGNTGATETFAPSIGRTEFQTKYVEEISQRSDFDFFCGNPKYDEKYRGPFWLTFYTRDGALHLHVVGQKKVLRKVE